MQVHHPVEAFELVVAHLALHEARLARELHAGLAGAGLGLDEFGVLVLLGVALAAQAALAGLAGAGAGARARARAASAQQRWRKGLSAPPPRALTRARCRMPLRRPLRARPN